MRQRSGLLTPGLLTPANHPKAQEGVTPLGMLVTVFAVHHESLWGLFCSSSQSIQPLVFLTSTCSVKCLVSAVREGKESSSLVESEPHHGSGAVAGQSLVEQAWKWVQRSELETGGSADSVSQTHLEVRGLSQMTKYC